MDLDYSYYKLFLDAVWVYRVRVRLRPEDGFKNNVGAGVMAFVVYEEGGALLVKVAN